MRYSWAYQLHLVTKFLFEILFRYHEKVNRSQALEQSWAILVKDYFISQNARVDYVDTSIFFAYKNKWDGEKPN